MYQGRSAQPDVADVMRRRGRASDETAEIAPSASASGDENTQNKQPDFRGAAHRGDRRPSPENAPSHGPLWQTARK